MIHFEPELIDAIKSLNPNASVRIGNNDISDIKWGDGTTPISTSDIQTEYNRLNSEYIAQEYARNRAAEYPAIGDQLDMLYHAIDAGKVNKTSDFYKALKAVKDKYPKPE